MILCGPCPPHFPPCTKFLWGHTLNMLFKHHLPSYPATQKHWKRCRSSLWKSCERAVACPVWSSSSRTPPVLLCKLGHTLRSHGHVFWNSPPESIFIHPRLSSHNFKFHRHRCYTHRHQYAFSVRSVPFWKKMPTEIVNASTVKSFKALLDSNWRSLFPEVQYKPRTHISHFPCIPDRI